jgi:hypothetical protein
MNHKLTLFDMPKPFLVGIIEALGFPVDDTMIARAIIQHRLHRSGRHADQYRVLTAAAKKKRSARLRRDLEIQAQRHAVNSTTLFESAKKLADQYGLTEKYFNGRKEKTGQAIRRPHHET